MNKSKLGRRYQDEQPAKYFRDRKYVCMRYGDACVVRLANGVELYARCDAKETDANTSFSLY